MFTLSKTYIFIIAFLALLVLMNPKILRGGG